MAYQLDLNISLKEGYKVFIGKEVWDEFLYHCKTSYSSRKIFIIIDENVNSFYGQEIKQRCREYFKNTYLIEIPAGEKSKSVSVWSDVCDEVLGNGVERTTPVVAAGGGVTGDLAGFVASTALRGVPFIQLPTTLLAMVDSSVGGKTGVNHAKGKNLIGSYYQPDAVFARLSFLKTLPEQEWVNGLAEMLKYAAISNPGLFDKLEEAVSCGFTPNEQWEQLTYECVKIKGDIVEADAREAGVRAFLNFGHTFGHALEKLAGFKTISHGEAVFAGMFAATYLSTKKSAPVQMARFYPFKTLYDIELPKRDKIETLIKTMHADKKVKDEKLRLILLKDWGEPVIKNVNDKNLLKEAWLAAYQELKK